MKQKAVDFYNIKKKPDERSSDYLIGTPFDKKYPDPKRIFDPYWIEIRKDCTGAYTYPKDQLYVSRELHHSDS